MDALIDALLDRHGEEITVRTFDFTTDAIYGDITASGATDFICTGYVEQYEDRYRLDFSGELIDWGDASAVVSDDASGVVGAFVILASGTADERIYEIVRIHDRKWLGDKVYSTYILKRRD